MYILVKRTITIKPAPAPVANPDNNNNNKEVIFENCTIFTDWIIEISKTKIDIAKDINLVIPKYNLIEYGNNYSKISEILWQCQRNEPFLDPNGGIANFPATNNNSALFKFKQKITCETADCSTKDFENNDDIKIFK